MIVLVTMITCFLSSIIIADIIISNNLIYKLSSMVNNKYLSYY